MSVGRMVVELDLDDGKFQAKIRGDAATLDRFARSVNKNSGAVRESTRVTHTWGATLRDSVQTLGLAREALSNLNFFLLGFPRAIINVNAQLEQMTALMRGLSAEGNNMAEMNKNATRTLRQLFDISNQSPFAIDAVTDSYVKMKAAGLEPLNGTLQALIESGAKFGASNESLKRASIAIQQMAGKGVISMEELRQQLGEAIPDAIMTMARSLRISMGDLVKLVSSGTLEAKNAISSMTRQMAIENAGSAALMAQTWDGLTNRLKNRWIEFAKIVGDAGFYDEAKNQMENLVSGIMIDPRTLQMARDLGQAMTTMIEVIVASVHFIADYGKHMLALGAALLLVRRYQITAIGVQKRFTQELGRGRTAITAVTGAWGRWTALQERYVSGVSMQVLSQQGHHTTSTLRYARALGTAQAAIRVTTVALTGLGRAMWTALGPIGLIAIAVEGLIFLWGKLGKSQEEAMRNLRENVAFGASKKDLDEIVTKVKKAEKTIIDAENNIALLKGIRDRKIYGLLPSADNSDAIKAKQEDLADAKADLAELMSLKGIANESVIKANIRQIMGLATQTVSNEISVRAGKIKAELGLLEKEFAADQTFETKEDRRRAWHRVAAEIENSGINDQIDAWKRRESELLKIAESGMRGRTELSKQEQAAYKRAADKAANKATELAKTLLDPNNPDKIVTIEGSSDQARTSALAYLNRIESSLADIRAEAKGANGDLAKFEETLRQGKLAGLKPEEQNKIRAMITERTKLQKQMADDVKDTKAYNQAMHKLTNVQSLVEGRSQKLSNDNPFLKAQAGARLLQRQLVDLQAELMKLTGLTGDKDAKRDGAVSLIDALLKSVETGSVKDAINTMIEDIQSFEEAHMSAADAAKASYDRQTAYVKKFVADNKDFLTEDMKAIIAQYKVILKERETLESNSFASLLEEWKNATYEMDDVWSDMTKGLSESLTDFLMTGEASFGDFLTGIAEKIIQSNIQEAIAGMFSGTKAAGGSGNDWGGMLSGVMSGIMGAFGGGTSAGSTTADYTGSAYSKWVASQSVKTYANGGIANRPQVAVFGEGDRPEAFVPLPDGRTIPVTMSSDNSNAQSKAAGAPPVQVNVVNQTSQEADAQQGEARFDGEKWVLDVVLKNMNQPGKFRSSMRGSR